VTRRNDLHAAVAVSIIQSLILLIGRNNGDRLSFGVVGSIAGLQRHHHAYAVSEYDEEHEENNQHAPYRDVEESNTIVVVAELIVADAESLNLQVKYSRNV
jgi:hypothetical protein